MSRRLAGPFLIACASVAALSACSNARRTLGLEQPPPDAFAVTPEAPLTVPPNFSLRPPEPGAERPQDERPRVTASKALTGQTPAADPSISPGTAAILAKTGADTADPTIRRQVDRETSLLATESSSFVRDLMFWEPKGIPGTPVDAAKEAARIREAQAEGKTPAEGGPTPMIERKKRAFFQGVSEWLGSWF